MSRQPATFRCQQGRDALALIQQTLPAHRNQHAGRLPKANIRHIHTQKASSGSLHPRRRHIHPRTSDHTLPDHKGLPHASGAPWAAGPLPGCSQPATGILVPKTALSPPSPPSSNPPGSGTSCSLRLSDPSVHPKAGRPARARSLRAAGASALPATPPHPTPAPHLPRATSQALRSWKWCAFFTSLSARIFSKARVRNMFFVFFPSYMRRARWEGRGEKRGRDGRSWPRVEAAPAPPAGN